MTNPLLLFGLSSGGGDCAHARAALISDAVKDSRFEPIEVQLGKQSIDATLVDFKYVRDFFLSVSVAVQGNHI